LENIQEKPVDIDDALSFADILSKSTGTSFSDTHKIRAQEMMALLYDMYPDNDDIKYCLGAVLANTGNYLGLNRMMPQFESASVMEKLFMYCNMNYLSIPTDKNEHFFPAQKNIYDTPTTTAPRKKKPLLHISAAMWMICEKSTAKYTLSVMKENSICIHLMMEKDSNRIMFCFCRRKKRMATNRCRYLLSRREHIC
jgi:hypothetical protein